MPLLIISARWNAPDTLSRVTGRSFSGLIGAVEWGHADRFWALALARQKEHGPGPKTGTEIGMRVTG